MLRFVLLLSGLGTAITLVVSISNYLLAYIVGKEGIAEAVSNNVYVKYWVTLAAVFLGLTILLLIFSLLTNRKKTESEQVVVPSEIANYREFHHTFVNSSKNGAGQADEYVTVRVKKSELSKLSS